MSDNFSWTTNVGRWMGIPIQIHLLVFLFVAVIFGVEWNVSQTNSNLFGGTVPVTLAVLMVSIVIHELAHAFANSNLGGHLNRFVLTPWGGNSDLTLPPSGQSRAVVYLAGPFVNCVIFLFGTALLVQSDNSTLLHLINPFEPHGFNTLQWQVSLIEIVTWVNFQLMLINLIPCYPFDGAGIVRASIQMMNVNLTKFRVESAIKVLGHAVAFCFIGLAWFCRDYNVGPVQPTWMLLLMFGTTLIFTARYSLHKETESDADWDEDMEDVEYDSFYEESSFFDFSDETENTAYSQWLTEKQELRVEDEQRKEEEEDRQADEILKKLHGDGLSSLTEEEKTLLDRVSARIRRRRQQGV